MWFALFFVDSAILRVDQNNQHYLSLSLSIHLSLSLSHTVQLLEYIIVDKLSTDM